VRTRAPTKVCARLSTYRRRDVPHFLLPRQRLPHDGDTSAVRVGLVAIGKELVQHNSHHQIPPSATERDATYLVVANRYSPVGLQCRPEG
jgi:hypothetical protein